MFNLCAMQGNICKDIEMKIVGDNLALANFTVACTNKYKQKENTVFMECTAFGGLADTINKFFEKGKPIIVSGELQEDCWDDKDTGKKRYKKWLRVNNFDFVGGSKGSGGSGTAATTPAAAPMGEDEIPF